MEKYQVQKKFDIFAPVVIGEFNDINDARSLINMFKEVDANKPVSYYLTKVIAIY